MRRHLYPSFLVWHILKYSNPEVGRDTTSWIQMGNALNANGFRLSCCYQFIFSIWVLKWQIEVSLCPSTPPCLPPGDEGGQKSRKFLIPQHSTPRAPKHKPNSSHNASLLANLGFLPQRATSILNGNYYSLTHTFVGMYTHYLDCTDEMQKTKRKGRSSGGRRRRKWGVVTEKKGRKKSRNPEKRSIGQKKWLVCKCGVKEFRRREDV